MKKNRTSRWMLLAAVMIIAVSAFRGTYAWFQETDDQENRFRMPLYQVAIEEVFQPPAEWKPGETTRKEIYFVNTGSLDAVLRVTYLEYWKARSFDRTLSNTFDHDGDPATPEAPAAVKNWAAVWPEYAGETAQREWTDGGDGYFYYTKILKAGESTARILDSVTMNPDAGGGYSNAEYVLEFHVESFSVETDLAYIEKIWQKTLIIDDDGSIKWE